MSDTDKPIQWLTTAPNPHVRGYGADDGQRGWRQHAVRATDNESIKAVSLRSAACGLLPAHGWGLDLVADVMPRCVRCRRALGLACKTCRGKGFLRISETMDHGCPDCASSGNAPRANTPHTSPHAPR